MKKLINCFCLILFLSLVSFAQNTAGEGKPQTESKPKIYQNYLYKFSLEVPTGWTEISSDDSKIFLEAGKEMLKPTAKGNREIERSKQNTQILLHVIKSASAAPDNISFICAVENISPPTATIEQVMQATELSFQKNFGYTIISSAKKVQLGKRDFYSIKMSKTIESDVTVFQTLYFHRIGNKVLQFVVSYSEDANEEMIEKIMKTLKFEN